MRPWVRRVLFYGGSLLASPSCARGSSRTPSWPCWATSTGQSAYDFVRTNVEAPITAIVIALYLDLVLRHRPTPPVPTPAAEALAEP